MKKQNQNPNGGAPSRSHDLTGSVSVKKTLEGVIIPIAYELMMGVGDSRQQYIDLNEMWLDLYGEQLFPTQNK